MKAKKENCKECDGIGRCSNQGTYPPKRREHIRWWDCRACGGTGKVDANGQAKHQA